MTRITVRTTKIAITRRISLVTLICAPSFLNVSEILCPVRMDDVRCSPSARGRESGLRAG